eukprot:10488302-Lingulodinium_polyedra.AAC.1
MARPVSVPLRLVQQGRDAQRSEPKWLRKPDGNDSYDDYPGHVGTDSLCGHSDCHAGAKDCNDNVSCNR